MKVAHLSDLHLLSLEGAIPFRLLNKRLTGYVNIRLKRGSVHKPFAVAAAARAIRELGVDHVVITGDVSNLALEVEFELVRRFLEEDLALPPDAVSLVPGNHDVYTRGALRSRRFTRFFEPYLRSDLPGASADLALGPFPFVRLRGPLAFIGLSTAVPRAPLVAAGELGRLQLEALERVLDHPEVRRRMPVLLQHHPWHNPPRIAKRLLDGLADAGAQAACLARAERGVLLHGHLHRRIHRRLITRAGHIEAIGATSASLIHDTDPKMAGFNVYEFGDADGALQSARSFRLIAGEERFREIPIPTA